MGFAGYREYTTAAEQLKPHRHLTITYQWPRVSVVFDPSTTAIRFIYVILPVLFTSLFTYAVLSRLVGWLQVANPAFCLIAIVAYVTVSSIFCNRFAGRHIRARTRLVVVNLERFIEPALELPDARFMRQSQVNHFHWKSEERNSVRGHVLSVVDLAGIQTEICFCKGLSERDAEATVLAISKILHKTVGEPASAFSADQPR